MRTSFLSLLVSLLFAVSVTAEQIKIPVGTQHKELSDISKPKRGQSKLLVEKQYGEPVQRYAERGQPPISRWEYPGFIVYFEHGHVIHSVIKHVPNAN
ncbi:MAG: phosphodiesterase [Pseudomonadales bacterium]